jgi:hypothetical protein
VAISVFSEEITNLMLAEVEEIIEAAVVVISKIIGTQLLVQRVRVVDNTLILATSRHNTFLLNSSSIRSTRVLLRVLQNKLPRRKRIARIYLDLRKNFGWKIRRPLRKQMKSRCRLQADLHRPDRRVNRTLQNLALPSRLHPNQPRLLRNPRSLKNSMLFRHGKFHKVAQTDLEVRHPHGAFQPNQRQLDNQNSENRLLPQPGRSRRS